MGDCLKLYKDKRHRSSSSIAGAALEGRFSERKLDIKAKIIEGRSIKKSPLTPNILEESWRSFKNTKMSRPDQMDTYGGPSGEEEASQNCIEEVPVNPRLVIHGPAGSEQETSHAPPKRHIWTRRSLGKVKRMRLSPQKHYEESTIASRMKQRAVQHGVSPDYLQMPFLSPKSTGPSHNIYANVQQVLSRAKSLSPFAKFHSGMLNRLKSPLRKKSPNKAASGGGDEEEEERVEVAGGMEMKGLAAQLVRSAKPTRALRTPQRSGDPEEFAVDCIRFPNVTTSKAKKIKKKFFKHFINEASGSGGDGGDGAKKESKTKLGKRNLIKRLF